MFYGQHTIHFNKQRAISLPERFARELQGNVFVTQGFDQNLILMPEKVFLDLYQRVNRMNMANPVTRLFLRHLLANAAFLSQEEIGSIEISSSLYEYADLPQEDAAVVVGQGDHLEIWGQKKWQEQSLDLQDAAKNALKFARLDLGAN